MFFLRCIELAALVGVVVSLLRRRLFPSYPYFVVFLLAKGFRSASLLELDYTTVQYAKCWAFTVPVVLFFEILAVQELFNRFVEHLPGIDSKSARIITTSCLAVGALAGGVSQLFQYSRPDCPMYVLFSVGAWKFGSWFCAIAIAFLSVWIAFTAVPVAKNLRIHQWLLAVYLGGAPGLTAIFTIIPHDQHYIQTTAVWALEIIETICCILWISLLKPEGEAVPWEPRNMNEEEFEEFCRQYDAEMEETLSQAPSIPGRFFKKRR